MTEQEKQDLIKSVDTLGLTSGRHATGGVAIGTSEEQMKLWTEDYLMRYHPLGYETTVTSQAQLETGEWYVSVFRYNSCS